MSEGLLGVSPAAFPDNPQALSLWVGERPLLARLLDALPGVPPAKVAPLARGEGGDRERRLARAAEAQVVAVRDRRQLAVWGCLLAVWPWACQSLLGLLLD